MHELLWHAVLVGGTGAVLLALNALLHHLTYGGRRRRGWNAARTLALLAVAAALGSSCVSVRARPAEPLDVAADTGAVEVRIYETLRARRAGTHTTRTIVSELWRRDGHDWTLVREAREPVWTASALTPGKYRVRVGRWVGEGGAEQPLGSQDRATFRIAGGERVGVDVVLSHPGRPARAVIIPLVAVAATYAIAHAVMESWTFSLGPM